MHFPKELEWLLSDSVHKAFFANDQICKSLRWSLIRDVEITVTKHSIRRSGIPRKKQAAVIVLLYEQGGELRVLLTTRSKLLRAHPGQTALPGGKTDETDVDLVYTAVRFPHIPLSVPVFSPTNCIA